MPPGEQAYIVGRLLEEIEHEDDPDICASILGLPGSIRDNGVSATIVIEGVAWAAPGRAIPIIWKLIIPAAAT